MKRHNIWHTHTHTKRTMGKLLCFLSKRICLILMSTDLEKLWTFYHNDSRVETLMRKIHITQGESVWLEWDIKVFCGEKKVEWKWLEIKRHFFHIFSHFNTMFSSTHFYNFLKILNWTFFTLRVWENAWNWKCLTSKLIVLQMKMTVV